MQAEKKRSGPKSVFDREENLKELISMYEKGCNMKDVAKHFQTSVKSCYRALEKARNKYGKKFRKPSRSFFSDKKKYNKLVKMYRKNKYSMEQIAKHFGVSKTTCYKALQDAEPKVRFTGTILGNEEKRKEFLQMHKSGCSMKEITDYFQICLATGYRTLSRLRDVH